jgi:DNA polymerase
MSENNERLRSVLLGRLESLQRSGVEQLPRARARAASSEPASTTVAEVEREPIREETPMARAATGTATKKNESSSGRSRADGASLEVAAPSSAATLEVLQNQVASCTQCQELATTRTQTVFGVGNLRARLCFMGEAPGADEDRLGEPFVGRAGQLLDKIIEACQLKREDVYILNMLKCRPPGNRNPAPDELANCRPFLERQLDLIEPEYICCLGAVASQNLLGVTTPIGKLRGKLHAYRGAQVVCTYHPAYLLRNPAAKKDCWDDMKFLMREMGVEL